MKPVPAIHEVNVVNSRDAQDASGRYLGTVCLERALVFEEVAEDGKVVGRWTHREGGELWRASAKFADGGWAFAISPLPEEAKSVLGTFLERKEAGGYWALGSVQFEAKLDLERAQNGLHRS